ncbi:MAG: LuxR C-terminal-related transcriptional regulator [Rhodococcus sp. (in: high G+C Gram-positive bacteria)]|uniref:LuxR C-terminal-related transcriptional regulator n=1 Tax=Rhodococcus sp. TaxID=1831 RepID=UPI002ADB30EB|nr:LuxR C-terminal-related transcriptional regulator [Rhodococcus sp. (in: high G+C Gram-positive bacteria)]
MSLAFSGRVESGGIVLSHFDGDVVGPLRGVRLEPGQGLAGPVLGLQRPMAVGEYMTAPVFSHRMDYDEIIRAEQLRSFAAVPVVVGRKAIAVLYASHRAGSFELGRMLDSVAREARALEQEIAVARAVDALLDAPRVASTDLSLVAQQISDPAVRAEIMRIAEGLATTSPPLSTRQRAVTLTARELDVLALLTSGLKNPAIAEALGISAHTVKDHVKNLLAKLQVSNRMEAVTIARRQGLIP